MFAPVAKISVNSRLVRQTVTGNNVHIHDCRIWNQDDCISVKDGATNMLFERISCSGLGLVIGSIGASRVDNITFRDCTLPSTFKGIYMKTRWSDSGPVGPSASISNILYENIVMQAPEQYAMYVACFCCPDSSMHPSSAFCNLHSFSGILPHPHCIFSLQLDRTRSADWQSVLAAVAGARHHVPDERLPDVDKHYVEEHSNH